MLRRVSIATRLFGLVGFVILFSAASIICAAVIAIPLQDTIVRNTQQIMLEDQKSKIKAAAHTMAAALGQALQKVSGAGERDDLVRKMLEPVRFEDDSSGYYFVYRGTTNVALPPRAELVGYDLDDFMDSNGVFYVRELARRAREGGGFVEYIFPKPGASQERKLSYSEMIPGTDLWIGTGVYIDNMQREETRIAAIIRGHFEKAATISVALFTAMVAVLCALCLAIGHSVARPLAEATRAAERIAGGDLEVRLNANGNDEASRLQAALNTMTVLLRQNIQEIHSRREEAEEKAALAQQALQEAKIAGQEVVAQVALRIESLQKISDAVAHQLRNPTTIIGGLAGLLLKQPSLRQSYLEYLDGIINAARRIEHITAAVEEYSSIHLSKLDTVFVRDALAEGLNAGETAARELGMQVSWEIDVGEAQVMADGALLSMALREIMVNAVEALSTQGGLVRVEATASAEGCRIAVIDSGRGVREEDLRFLTDPFYTTKPVGVGMGLTKALRAVQEHGGDISISGAPGKGTSVTVFLPGDRRTR